MRLLLAPVALTIVAAMTACSGLAEPPYQPCVPGKAEACTCADGSAGSQVCADSGDAYSDCKCEAGAGSGSGSGSGELCSGDLSNIGTGDFHISFDFGSRQSAMLAIMNQRTTCERGMFWDVYVNGSINIETDDGTTYAPVGGGRDVTDGAAHAVEIARVSGTVSITVDGAADASGPSPVSFGALPPLAIGSDPCGYVAVTSLASTCVASP